MGLELSLLFVWFIPFVRVVYPSCSYRLLIILKIKNKLIKVLYINRLIPIANPLISSSHTDPYYPQLIGKILEVFEVP